MFLVVLVVVSAIQFSFGPHENNITTYHNNSTTNATAHTTVQPAQYNTTHPIIATGCRLAFSRSLLHRPTGNKGSMVRGQCEKGVLRDSRALLQTLALFCWGHTLKNKCQAACSKLTLSGGPFKTSQVDVKCTRQRKPSTNILRGDAVDTPIAHCNRNHDERARRNSKFSIALHQVLLEVRDISNP